MHSFLTHLCAARLNVCGCDVETPAGAALAPFWGDIIEYDLIGSLFLLLWKFANLRTILRAVRGDKMTVGINNNAKESYL